MLWLSKIWTFLTGGGIVEKAFDLIDKKFDNDIRKEELKAQVFIEHIRGRASWLAAGGFWTLLPFTLVTLFHYGSVVVYSVFWCSQCAFPKPWIIAALPAPMNEWEGWIILASIGALGVLGYAGRKK